MVRGLSIGLLACAAMTWGCGGKTPREQFIADGNEVCRASAPRLERLAPGITPTPGALLGNTSEYRAVTRTIAARLAASRPAGDAPARQIVTLAARLTSAARNQKVIAQQIASAGGRSAELRGYGAFWPALGRMRDDVARPLDRRLRRYGFTACRLTSSLGLNL